MYDLLLASGMKIILFLFLREGMKIFYLYMCVLFLARRRHALLSRNMDVGAKDSLFLDV